MKLKNYGLLGKKLKKKMKESKNYKEGQIQIDL